ncbi:hypothetical protein PAHAL_6G196500 [Panicum hallii]|jgi:hypothetical protein|uniref:Uncharacterized protein n=1 Tax=Panicum hallii TaxID=206008 RepID=A0A2T8IGW3_9POAL|nr:hypothetical protein PAHAL_6G196500 [Panicum hallii]
MPNGLKEMAVGGGWPGGGGGLGGGDGCGDPVTDGGRRERERQNGGRRREERDAGTDFSILLRSTYVSPSCFCTFRIPVLFTNLHT